MRITPRLFWSICCALLALIVSSLLVISSTIFSHAAVSLTQLSTDPYTNSSSQHQTEVEPASYTYGSTMVSAFQAGRFPSYGSSNIGWATSTNRGKTWTHGFLPGTTIYAGGSYAHLNNASVAFDPAHNTWMISSIAISNINGVPVGVATVVNLSTDGGHTWSNPIVVQTAPSGSSFDKDWIVCDTTSTSIYYGHCYVEWNNIPLNNLIQMSTSIDGGNTWGAAQSTINNGTGLAGQPLVQPNGTVIVPINNAHENGILAFNSIDGGTTWGSPVTVATISAHLENGGFRSRHFPSAGIDGSGKVYVVWQDCRFEVNCSANDMVITTSIDGNTWSPVQLIPIDMVGSGIDHFIPGLAVNKSTSSSSTHLALTYYYYPVSNCIGPNPTPTPTFTPTASPTPSPSPSPSPTATSTDTPTPTGSATTHTTNNLLATLTPTSTQISQTPTPTQTPQAPNCQLDVGYVSSTNGGATWSKNTQLAGPMDLSWLPKSGGYMVGGYIATTIAGGRAYPFFALATAPSGGNFQEAIYTVTSGLSI